MRLLSIHACFLSAGLMLGAAGLAHSQNFPVKPIRIVASQVGGAGDIAARVIAQGISGPLGQPVIVDNRGGGVIPASYVSKAQPDGYTVLFHGSSLWLLPFMRDNLPWDPLRDFAPITLAITSANLVVVHPAQPINSIKDLIAVAKARPGQLNDAGGQTGASSHLASELFKAMAGVDIVRVPYKGVGPALNALVAGGRGGAGGKRGRAACPRGDECATVRAASRPAHGRGFGLTGLRSGIHFRHVCTGQDASGDHQPAQPRNSAPSEGA